jgi:ribosomal protein S18 acetylase RimI-like enzyme
MIFAKDGDKLIGMMGAFWDPTKDTAYIIAVYLQAEYRGKGISKQMMKELLAEIKKKEYIKRIVLGVNKSQEAAIKLYESFGFKQTKVEEAVLGDGNSHCEIIMERKITL